MFALYFCLLLIRLFVVLLCAPFFRWSGYGLQPRVCSPEKFLKYLVILSWGGLRGAVGLVLALVVSEETHLDSVLADRDPHYRQHVLLHTGGIVVLTTLVNAASLEKLIIWFGLADPTDTEEQLKISAKRFLVRKHHEIVEEYQNRQNYPDLASVDWKAVEKLVGTNQVLRDHSHHPDDDFSSFHHAWKENDFLGRYLVSLRCSYSSQFAHGLLSPLAYRQISWALGTAMDHCNDKQTPERDKKFEWGWIIEEGYLELPWWLGQAQKTLETKLFGMIFSESWRGTLVQKWSRHAHAMRMEIMLAVARAHDDTLRCEVYPDDAPVCVQTVMDESRCIKKMAENKYAELQYKMPDISCAVRTRQTCQMILNRFKEELDTLQSTAQITSAEFEHMEHSVFNKKLGLTYNLPAVGSAFEKKRRRSVDDNESVLGMLSGARSELHYYFSQADLLDLSSELAPETFKPGKDICLGTAGADELYIIVQGMVRVHKDESNVGDARMSLERGRNKLGDIQEHEDAHEQTQDTHEHPHPHSPRSPSITEVTSPKGAVKSNSNAPFAAASQQDPTKIYEMLLGAGCCINDVEFLLHDAGYESLNFGHVVAVTEVRLLRLRFADLRLRQVQYLAFLEKMWRNSGKALCARCPDRVNFQLPSAEWNWNTAALTHYAKDACITLRTPAFLIEGVVEDASHRVYQAFEFVQPFMADELVVLSESCKILQCSNTTKKAGTSRASIDVGPATTSAASSSVERRSLEMARPSLGNRLTSPELTPKSRRGARGVSLDMSRPTTNGVQMKHLSTILAANTLTKRSSPRHLPKPVSTSHKQSLDLEAAPAQFGTQVQRSERFELTQPPTRFDLQTPPPLQRMELSDISLSEVSSMKHPKQRLAELKELLEDELINKDEFDKQRAAILGSI
mmetsp:Transcript_21264/g.34013  ORF Transcript_21264/g.34013 Transcript_21264/m.34013 type:complete len:909 (-) Transcript_21264:186-2912(-)